MVVFPRCESLATTLQQMEKEVAAGEEERNNLRHTTAEATLLLAEMKTELEVSKASAVNAAAAASSAVDSMQKVGDVITTAQHNGPS